MWNLLVLILTLHMKSLLPPSSIPSQKHNSASQNEMRCPSGDGESVKSKSTSYIWEKQGPGRFCRALGTVWLGDAMACRKPLAFR